MAFRMKVDKAALAALTKVASSVKQAVDRAARNAGDKAGRQLVTSMQKYVQSKKNLKSAFVRAAMELKRPTQTTGLEAMRWRVKVVGKPVPVAQYPITPGKRGVRARINKGKSTLIASAFVVPAFDGGVFVRTGKARGPLKQLYTSRITDVLSDAGVIDGLLAQAQTTLRTAMSEGLGAQLAKLAVGAAVKGGR